MRRWGWQCDAARLFCQRRHGRKRAGSARPGGRWLCSLWCSGPRGAAAARMAGAAAAVTSRARRRLLRLLQQQLAGAQHDGRGARHGRAAPGRAALRDRPLHGRRHGHHRRAGPQVQGQPERRAAGHVRVAARGQRRVRALHAEPDHGVRHEAVTAPNLVAHLFTVEPVPGLCRPPPARCTSGFHCGFPLRQRTHVMWDTMGMSRDLSPHQIELFRPSKTYWCKLAVLTRRAERKCQSTADVSALCLRQIKLFRPSKTY